MDVLTPGERDALRALVDTVFPAADDGWSASRIGVVEYVETRLGSDWGDGRSWYASAPFDAGAVPAFGWQGSTSPVEAYRAHLAALDAEALRRHGAALAALTSGQLDVLVGDLADDRLAAVAGVRSSAFFDLLRTQVLEGVLRDPSFGGNRDGSGWRWLLGDPDDTTGAARDVLS